MQILQSCFSSWELQVCRVSLPVVGLDFFGCPIQINSTTKARDYLGPLTSLGATWFVSEQKFQVPVSPAINSLENYLASFIGGAS